MAGRLGDVVDQSQAGTPARIGTGSLGSIDAFRREVGFDSSCGCGDGSSCPSHIPTGRGTTTSSSRGNRATTTCPCSTCGSNCSLGRRDPTPAVTHDSNASNASNGQRPSATTVLPPTGRVKRARQSSPAGMLVILMLVAVVIGTAIWGYNLYTKNKREAYEIEAFNKLTDQQNENPKGTPESVRILASIMQQRGGNALDHGALSLEKLTGSGVEQAIVNHIGLTAGPTRIKFIEIAVKRELKGTVAELVNASLSKDDKVRDAALGGLAELAQPKDLDKLFGLIEHNHESTRNRLLLTEAIYAAASRAEGSKGSVKLISALRQVEGGSQQGVLLKVLGRLGGDAALATLKDKLEEGDEVIQRAAVLGLTSWPNGKAAPILSEFAESTENQSLRSSALMGLVKVIGRSGDIPGEKKVEALVKAAKSARTSGREEDVVSAARQDSGRGGPRFS